MCIKNLIFAFILYSSAGFVSNVNQLEIKIWSDKGEYLIREPILIHYEVKNIGDSTIVLNFLALSNCFVIKDQAGQILPTGVSFFYAVENPDSLESDSSYTGYEDITDRHAMAEVGEYSCYIQMPVGGSSPVAGIKSNSIRIRVNASLGEEKKALDLLLEADGLTFSPDKDPGKIAMGFYKYLELVDKFPSSVYTPKALRSAWGVYIYSGDLEERKKVIPVFRKLIESYPNSYYFVLAFTELVDVYEILKDKAGAVYAMNELIAKHPNTKISEEAKRRLEQIEKWKF